MKTFVSSCSGMVLTTRKAWLTHDDKMQHMFHLEFIAGLPQDEGFKNIHVEDFLVVKNSKNAIFAAVDILAINEHLEQKFWQTDSEACSAFRFLGQVVILKMLLIITVFFRNGWH